MPPLARFFWFVFTLEIVGVGWLLTRAIPEMGRRYTGDAPVLLGLAAATAILLIADAAMFHYSRDRAVRRTALAVLLAAAVVPAARILA